MHASSVNKYFLSSQFPKDEFHSFPTRLESHEQQNRWTKAKDTRRDYENNSSTTEIRNRFERHAFALITFWFECIFKYIIFTSGYVDNRVTCAEARRMLRILLAYPPTDEDLRTEANDLVLNMRLLLNETIETVEKQYSHFWLPYLLMHTHIRIHGLTATHHLVNSI